MCSNGVQDSTDPNTETDVDCGGTTCPACLVGKKCLVGTDCTTGICNGAAGTCDCPQGMVKATAGDATTGKQFCIDVNEVTGGAYQTWLSTAPSTASQSSACTWNADFTPQGAWPPADSSLPVSYVDWCDAAAYCAGNGKQLCGSIDGGTVDYTTGFQDQTLSEWMAACTGPNAFTYPYGNSYGGNTCNGTNNGVGTTVAAGSLTTCAADPVNGPWDLSGNVTEWEDSCNAATGQADSCHVRGGSYADTQFALRCNASASFTRVTADPTIGFRCCAGAPATSGGSQPVDAGALGERRAHAAPRRRRARLAFDGARSRAGGFNAAASPAASGPTATMATLRVPSVGNRSTTFTSKRRRLYRKSNDPTPVPSSTGVPEPSALTTSSVVRLAELSVLAPVRKARCLLSGEN